jgi:hypothetical protein
VQAQIRCSMRTCSVVFASPMVSPVILLNVADIDEHDRIYALKRPVLPVGNLLLHLLGVGVLRVCVPFRYLRDSRPERRL